MRIGGGDVDYGGLNDGGADLRTNFGDTSSDDDTDSTSDTDSSSDSDSSSTDSSYIVGRGEKDLDSGSAGNESADYNDRDENTTGGITRSQKQEGTEGNNDPDSGTAGNTDETPEDELAPTDDGDEDRGTDMYLPGSNVTEDQWDDQTEDAPSSVPANRDARDRDGDGTTDAANGEYDAGSGNDNAVADWLEETSEDLGLDNPDGPVIDDLDLPNMPGTDGDGDGVDLDGDGEGIGDEGLDDLTDALNLDDINIPTPEVPGVDVPWKLVGAGVAVGAGVWLLRPYAGLADSAT